MRFKKGARGDNRSDGIFPRNDNMAFMPLIDSINHSLSSSLTAIKFAI
jgi:hypothetical protein